MSRLVSTLLAAALMAVPAAPLAFAQSSDTSAATTPPAPTPPADPSAEVAKVGDRSITNADLDEAMVRLGQQFASVPEPQRRARVLDALIDFSALAREAEKRGIDKQEDVQRLLAYLRLQALHNAYFRNVVQGEITDEMVRARYDQQIAKATPEQEVKAAHILVKTEEEARAIIAELEGGADFAELAKTKSIGPSGPQGGELGTFQRGRMVPAFEKAAFEIVPGQVSKEPVKTQFGYHIIRVDEKRDLPLPTYEQSKQQIQQLLLTEAYSQAVQDARKAAGVTIMDDALKLPAKE